MKSRTYEFTYVYMYLGMHAFVNVSSPDVPLLKMHLDIRACSWSLQSHRRQPHTIRQCNLKYDITCSIFLFSHDHCQTVLSFNTL